MMRAVSLCVLLLASQTASARAQCVVESLQNDVAEIREILKTLALQIKNHQVDDENSLRTAGQSGLKNIRSVLAGRRPFQEESFTGRTSIAHIHNHANNIRTVGLGELAVVMNGIEFQTRHNDFRLNMKSTTTTGFAAEPVEIPFPDVPQAVLDQPTVEAQVTEMREWFRAFYEQKTSIRDYKDYFPAVICYLEGAYFYSNLTDIVEGFHSDRHHLEARSWRELRDQADFCSKTGHKNEAENVATMRNIIVGVDEDGKPIQAQWNYRILCHPISYNVPTNRFVLVDDLRARAKRTWSVYRTLAGIATTRAARYKLKLFNNATDDPADLREESTTDKFMRQVYGYNNFGGKTDDVYDSVKSFAYDGSSTLNAYKYHSKYRSDKKGANGLDIIGKGHNDPHLYFAMTNDESVVEQEMTTCNKLGNNCQTWKQRWSYAIPLEITYLTPLQSWNPYNLTYHGEAGTTEGDIAVAPINGTKRDGSSAFPLNGTNSKNYYRTPQQFFTGIPTGDDADTSSNSVHVLDANGIVRQVWPSGIHIHLPSIDTIDGIIRTRYPIFPIHSEGSDVWKEVDALKAVVLDPAKHGDLVHNSTEA